MVVKYVSVCELKAPAGDEKPKYHEIVIFPGKKKDETGFMFEPFLLGEQKVLHVEELPFPMADRYEVAEWFHTKEAKQILDMVKNEKKKRGIETKDQFPTEGDHQ